MRWPTMDEVWQAGPPFDCRPAGIDAPPSTMRPSPCDAEIEHEWQKWELACQVRMHWLNMFRYKQY